ncbi:stage II sporulation protein P [Paenibacillus sediminis]|uniref:Stage II sporulation protein P n=1 Tax=Paenibacillus sediminis TaxID=664909 RepID=A0ABS4GYM5_9BACL|nr:stage II sporulation protein P [Paenibacillus sediminis]MBP1935368.1 stage II sporulation protein P [Paenibacillus sediminis]
MKWLRKHTNHISRWKENMMRVLVMGQTFALLTIGSMVFFMVLGLGGMAEKSLHSSPVSSMKGFAATVSSRFFMDMIGMEMPYLKTKQNDYTFSAKNMTTFVFQLLTNVNPMDPKTLIAREVPGIGADDPVLLRHGSGNEEVDAPQDYHSDTNHDDTVKIDEHNQEPQQDPSSNDQNNSKSGQSDTSGNAGDSQPSKSSSKKVVMIYHSHPRESFNPMLHTNNDNPESNKLNVGTIGEFMAKRLEDRGVGVFHSRTDYASTIANYNYYYSYKYSRETVKAAIAQYNDLNYFIDIHRDSQHYQKTTATIGGVSYAKVYFIIGHENKNWSKNEKFANEIHERLEKAYPGVSRGVWAKTAKEGNGEYNQSFSPNSILIEVGGVDNSEEELERTVDILANIITDIYWTDSKAQTVNASSDGSGKGGK